MPLGRRGRRDRGAETRAPRRERERERESALGLKWGVEVGAGPRGSLMRWAEEG